MSEGPGRFVASAIVEVSDLRAFVADPARGVDVVGGIDSSAWGYRPFVRGSATVTTAGAGRTVEIDATVRVGGDDVRLVMSSKLPSGSFRSAARSWSVDVGGGGHDTSGTAHLSNGDALRTLYTFEPSGAHTLADRLRAVRTMARFVRSG
jgi:hypothetical protein